MPLQQNEQKSLDFIVFCSSHCLSESTKDYKIQGFWLVPLQRQAWLMKTTVKSKDLAQQIKSSKDSLGISKDPRILRSKDFFGQKSFISQKILGILGILGFYNGFLHVPSEILGILGNTQGILGTLDLLSQILGFYSCFR